MDNFTPAIKKLDINNPEDRKLLQLLTDINLRGVQSSDIVCEIQDVQERIENETSDEMKYYYRCIFNRLLNELERRTRLNDTGVRKTNIEIIQTIKDRIRIDTVMAWYTDVYVRNNNYNYRCPLCGDKNPSGKLYMQEDKFHCFQCQAHGDIFDCVQLCERVELIDAIKKLANYIGLEIKPFDKKPTDIDERLRQVEMNVENLNKKKSTLKVSKYD